MAPTDEGYIRQQLGEISGTVRSLAETLRDHREERIRQETRLSLDIQGIREERRQFDHTLSARLELLTRQIAQVDDRTKDLTGEFSTLKGEVGTIKSEVGTINVDVKGLMAIRRKIITYVMAAFTAVGAFWYLVGPILQQLVANWLSTRGH